MNLTQKHTNTNKDLTDKVLTTLFNVIIPMALLVLARQSLVVILSTKGTLDTYLQMELIFFNNLILTVMFAALLSIAAMALSSLWKPLHSTKAFFKRLSNSVSFSVLCVTLVAIAKLTLCYL